MACDDVPTVAALCTNTPVDDPVLPAGWETCERQERNSKLRRVKQVGKRPQHEERFENI